MEDHYEFSHGEDIEWKEPLGVQSMGGASSILPPYPTGTGLEPEEPNPYLGTRDAIYTYGYAKHHACKTAYVYSEGPGERCLHKAHFFPRETDCTAHGR